MELFRSHVLICGGTGCTSSGSVDLLHRFQELVKENHLEKEIKLDGFCVCTYGVEISKCMRGEDNVLHKEYRKVFDVFCTRKEAEEILEKLARNTVTPISLLDVLENLIGIGDLVNEETSFMAV